MHLTKRIGLVVVVALGMIFGLQHTADSGGVACAKRQLAQARVAFSPALERVGEGFTLPLFLTHAGDGSGRIFVVEERRHYCLAGERQARHGLPGYQRCRVRASGYRARLARLGVFIRTTRATVTSTSTTTQSARAYRNDRALQRLVKRSESRRSERR